MIERLLASWQASREEHAEGVEGVVWQTKGAARRCRDSATAFTQAGGHGRGGDSKLGRWWKATFYPPNTNDANLQILPHKLGASHSQTGVWVWGAACGNSSKKILNVACCNFSSSATATRVLCNGLWPVTITAIYIYTPERTYIHSGMGMNWDTFTGILRLLLFHPLQPSGFFFSFLLKSHSESTIINRS